MKAISHRELFPPDLEAETDVAWEANNFYDRYVVDSRLLENHSAILAYAEGRWNEGDWGSTQQLHSLLMERYQEIEDAEIASGEWNRKYGDHTVNVNTYGKLFRVFQEWEKHYFLPRTEEVGVDAYNDWAVTHLQFSGQSPERLEFPGAERSSNRPFRRALSPVRLVGMCSDLELIVPPGVGITGSTKKAKIYSWDNIMEPYADSLNIYPSTQEMLDSRGAGSLISQSSLLDAELQLRASHR